MKKSLLSLVLVLTIILSGFSSVNALSYSENSLSNFEKMLTYSEGTFNDISGWYVDYVKEAYEYGIITGIGSNRFAPLSNLTVQEAITIGARIHAIYKYGYDSATSKIEAYTSKSAQWYSKYIAYAKAEAIIGNEFDNLIGKPITRAQMVHCWSKILLPVDLPKTNTVKSLPDVNESTQYRDDIVMMYEAGILSGTDDAGTFMPDRDITRAECSTIFMRLIDKSSRSNGKSFSAGDQLESFMVGDVLFDPKVDTVITMTTDGLNYDYRGMSFQSPVMTMEGQNKFVGDMLRKSQGFTYDSSTKVVSFDFEMIPLPQGYEWDIGISWSIAGGPMGKVWSTEAGYVVDGHFKWTSSPMSFTPRNFDLVCVIRCEDTKMRFAETHIMLYLDGRTQDGETFTGEIYKGVYDVGLGYMLPNEYKDWPDIAFTIK